MKVGSSKLEVGSGLGVSKLEELKLSNEVTKGLENSKNFVKEVEGVGRKLTVSKLFFDDFDAVTFLEKITKTKEKQTVSKLFSNDFVDKKVTDFDIFGMGFLDKKAVLRKSFGFSGTPFDFVSGVSKLFWIKEAEYGC